MNSRQINALVAGDTKRWLVKIRKILIRRSVNIMHTKTCSVGAFEASIEDEDNLDVYVLANEMDIPDAGLMVLRELRRDKIEVPVIICSHRVTEEGQAEINKLNGTYIRWNPNDQDDDPELEFSAILDRLFLEV